MTRIAHISDLHFPADETQVAALAASIEAAAPHAVVVTGDVTTRGRRHEFLLAREFIADLPGEKLIVPGNHDIPVSAFAFRGYLPFRRFERFFPGQRAAVLSLADTAIVALNTATAASARIDWSLGDAKPARIEQAARSLSAAPSGAVRIVACHHPLLRHERDPERSRTRGGPQAFEVLADAGMDALLHGHLHWTDIVDVPWRDRTVRLIGANPALSDRERGSGTGYNLIDIEGGRIAVAPQVWADGAFRALAAA